MTTTLQNELIQALADQKITASFNGRFLNGTATITKINGKKKKQRFSIMFDDSATLEGPRVLFGSLKGTYAEGFAVSMFFEAIRIGQGDEAALKFANERRRQGITTGATHSWIDAHQDSLLEIVC